MLNEWEVLDADLDGVAFDDLEPEWEVPWEAWDRRLAR